MAQQPPPPPVQDLQYRRSHGKIPLMKGEASEPRNPSFILTGKFPVNARFRRRLPSGQTGPDENAIVLSLLHLHNLTWNRTMTVKLEHQGDHVRLIGLTAAAGGTPVLHGTPTPIQVQFVNADQALRGNETQAKIKIVVGPGGPGGFPRKVHMVWLSMFTLRD